MRIGLVAPGVRIDADIAARVTAIAAAFDPAIELYIHPQCFLSHGHFAGDDEARAAAFLEIANDPAYGALWFARGGYGSCRLVEAIVPKLADAARGKIYMGYSDAGSLLGALYRRGFPRIAHGPMPVDVIREDGGGDAVRRGLAFLVQRARDAIEPSVLTETHPAIAYNLSILSHAVGTPWQPDMTGHVLMLEEIGEHLYRIDRMFCQILSNAGVKRIAGVKLGRCSNIPENVIPFERTEEEIARDWCARASIPYLGRADIGHDSANRVVPFGRGWF